MCITERQAASLSSDFAQTSYSVFHVSSLELTNKDVIYLVQLAVKVCYYFLQCFINKITVAQSAGVFVNVFQDNTDTDLLACSVSFCVSDCGEERR